jgi:hypothetical protein
MFGRDVVALVPYATGKVKKEKGMYIVGVVLKTEVLTTICLAGL